MTRAGRGLLAFLTPWLLAVSGPLAHAVPAEPVVAPLPPPEPVCGIQDERLAELSGMAAHGSSWFAVEDGGSALRVYVLDPSNCTVRDVIEAPVDPFDVEDLAVAPDGSVWLADTGDNGRDRETVAIHVVTPSGAARTFRMTYPDGRHDAEALLLDRSGVPFIVTKQPWGEAGVYRPRAALTDQGTVPLERVASVRLQPTRTPGGPLSGTIGSVMVTGGSVSSDGSTVALRTYSEAYVFAAPEGDVVAALTESTPLRVSLPGEPQGEAVAIAPDGALLSASEGAGPVRAVPGVMRALLESNRERTSAEPAADRTDGAPDTTAAQGFSSGSLVVAGLVAALVMFLFGRLRGSK